MLHLAPRFPPALDGVGEYAARLAEELADRFSIQSQFLSADPAAPSRKPARVLPARSASALVAALEAASFDTLLLHFSGYGFQKRGAPLWLLAGIQQFVRVQGRDFAVFFHELWATGKPWKSAFYLGPVQRAIVLKLRRLARRHITSTPAMARKLGAGAAVAPIPSNIPEPAEVVPRHTAPFRILIFGQEHTRERSVRAHRRLLANLAARNALGTVTLAGRGAVAKAADFRLLAASVPAGLIRTLPDAAPSDLSQAFANANLCLSFYPADLITKSTTAASAFACGCPLVLPSWPGQPGEAFQPPPPIITSDGSDSSVGSLISDAENGTLENTARRGFAWYREHASWEAHSRAVGRLLTA